MKFKSIDGESWSPNGHLYKNGPLIVERTFGWLDKCRRLWKNCERKFYNTFYMFTIAFIRILLNRY